MNSKPHEDRLAELKGKASLTVLEKEEMALIEKHLASLKETPKTEKVEEPKKEVKPTKVNKKA